MKYNTEIKKLNRELIEKKRIERLQQHPAVKQAAELLKRGETVAFPTETVYGLGADATNEEAVKKIFAAKGRPADNPLIVHIAAREQLDRIMRGDLPEIGEKLVEKFWPGPLTLIVFKNKCIAENATGGLDTVAVRMPSHVLALSLIKVSGLPLAAPSANTSGRPSPTRASHVFDDLAAKIPLILDGGASPVGVESTVIDIRNNAVEILRPGGISREEIFNVLNKGPNDIIDNTNNKNNKQERGPLSPGMKYRHYSPQTPLYIIEGKTHDHLTSKIRDIYSSRNMKKDNRTGYILSRETVKKLGLTESRFVVKMGSRDNPAGIAARLFYLLRKLDKMDLDQIYIEAIPAAGIGEAVMNRIYKAGRRV